jgi:RNA polymerase sigma factor (sigma-70 family)
MKPPRRKRIVRSPRSEPNKNGVIADMDTPSATEDSFLPTRSSLLTRLKQWDDTECWREFFDTYGRVIHGLCLKAGLNRSEAEDVVQETMAAVAKQMPSFFYDRGRGTFKGWLFTITRRCIWRQLAKRERNPALPTSDPLNDELEIHPDAAQPPLEDSWEQEWRGHLVTLALDRVRRRVSAKQFQMFDLYVTQNQPMEIVTRTLGVNRAQVYMAKLRLSAQLRKEIIALEAKDHS